MKRGRVHYPLEYRRARTLVYGVVLFWLWAWLGSGAFIAGLFDSPLHAVVAVYALAVTLLVSFPVALLAVARMLLNRPHPATDDVGTSFTGELLGATRPPIRESDWWFLDRVS